jgi:membrane protein YqaA with SNARE-associated domain
MDKSSAVLLFASWAFPIFQFFRKLGPFGLLALSLLDSSLLILPFGNDLLLIALLTATRVGPIWILYVIMSAVGSMLGALIDDLLTRKAGEKGLNRFVSRQQIRRLKIQIEKRAGWVVFITTLLPPPFPFTAVIMTAAALQYSRRKLLLLVLGGRLVRFTLVALLALYFGRKLLVYARNSSALDYLVGAILLIAVAGSAVTIFKWLRK